MPESEAKKIAEKRTRVVPGSYYHPSYGEGNEGARFVFLRAILEYAPDVVAMLRQQVLPIFATFCKQTNRRKLTTEHMNNARFWKTGRLGSKKGRIYLANEIYWSDLQRFRRRSASLLKEELNAWANSYNLNEEWIKDVALTTLWYWRFLHGPQQPLWWMVYLHVFSAELDEIRLNFQHLGWDPSASSWPDAKERFIEDFIRWLGKDYKPTMTTLAKKRGFRESCPPKEPRHFEWLVHFQVNKQDYQAIASTANRDPSAVSEGCENAAELIGLTLRPASKGGRPRKH